MLTYCSVTNWLRGGTLLRSHQVPLQSPPHHILPTPVPIVAGQAPASAIPTSLALDSSWVVVGLANSRIHVFSARTGVLSRTLVGHESGVWAVALVRGGGGGAEYPEDADVPVGLRRRLSTGDVSPEFTRGRGSDRPRIKAQAGPGKPSDPCAASDGWGQSISLVVSGGCDKALRVWDVQSGCVNLCARPLTYSYRAVTVYMCCMDTPQPFGA